jgi:hypothetical protein
VEESASPEGAESLLGLVPENNRWRGQATRLRQSAALLGYFCRFVFDSFAARALPPLRPSSAAALCGLGVSSTSPVAIRMTCTALPITSAGRFSPFGPLGINHPKPLGKHLLAPLIQNAIAIGQTIASAALLLAY